MLGQSRPEQAEGGLNRSVTVKPRLGLTKMGKIPNKLQSGYVRMIRENKEIKERKDDGLRPPVRLSVKIR